MPRGTKLSNSLKAQIVAALATQFDKSIPEIAQEFGLHPGTLHRLSAKHNINRPVGAGQHKNKWKTLRKKQEVTNG